jgi:WD40 repeat protein
VWVWDAESGADLRWLHGNESGVTSVAFSPDGRRIVSGGRDKTVRVWDAESGAKLRVLRGHEYWVHSVAFSPDGRRIVSGSSDRTVRVWDAESGECLKVLAGQGDVAAIAAGPQSFPYRALAQGMETVIEDAKTSRPIAWFPMWLRGISTHHGCRMWAGASANHIYLLQLEGTPAP